MHGTTHACIGTAQAMKPYWQKASHMLLFTVAACACMSQGWAIGEGGDAVPVADAVPKFVGEFPRATANPVPQIPQVPLATPVVIPDLSDPDPLANVFFDYGSSAIRADAGEAIDTLARKLTLDRRATALLVGYSADLGSSEYGVALAGARTRAVAEELLKRGVRPTQIRHRPRGNAVATGQCATDACRRKQQRVELRLVE